MKILTSKQIDSAAALLREGEVIAFPTETVYGLGAPIYDEKAIAKIFAMKRRPADNPLIAHVSSIEQAEEIAKHLPKEFYILAKTFWPGPLSLLVEANEKVPSIAIAGLRTIAIRMPAHDAALKLIELTGPLVAPSANVSGKPSSTTIEHVQHDFERVLAAAIDGGPCTNGLESTVLDLYTDQAPRILRPGSITREQIEKVLGRHLNKDDNEERSICPGKKYRHYAPEAPIRIFHDELSMKTYLESAPSMTRMVLRSLSKETFYAQLRKADAERTQEIILLCDEKVRLDEALYNRILKAVGTPCQIL